MIFAQSVATTPTQKMIAIEIMKMSSTVGIITGAISLEEMKRALFQSIWDWAARYRPSIPKHGSAEDIRFWYKHQPVDTDQKWEKLSATEADFQITYGSDISSVSLPGLVTVRTKQINSKL